MNRKLTAKEIQIPFKDMKRCPTLVITEKCKLGFHWENIFYSIRLSKSESSWIHSVGKALGNRHFHKLLMVVDIVVDPLWRGISEYVPTLQMGNF